MPALKDVRVDFVSLVDRAAVRDPSNKSEPRRFLLAKREGDIEKEETMPADDELKKAQEERDEANEKLEKLEAKSGKNNEDRYPGDGDLDDEHDLASLRKGGPTGDAAAAKKDDAATGGLESDTRKEDIRKAEERVQKAEEAAAEATKLAKEERDMRLTGEFIKKAEELTSLSSDPTEMGPFLKRASERLEKSDFEYLQTVLKGADESIHQGDLFKEAGRSGSAKRPTGAYDTLKQKAEEIQKADPNISQGDALAKAMTNNPDLQRQYLSEMGSGAGR